MNYELANKLKEAGFPQNGKNGNYLACHSYDDDENCKEDGHIAHAPTLPELIEACRDSFDYLRAPYGTPEDTDFDVFWRAFSNHNDVTTPLFIKLQGEGSTPEEAVARLWLALHKKS